MANMLQSARHSPAETSDPAARPSSQRRASNLRKLLDALAQQELDMMAIASLLECSPSTARNYVCELIDAKVIASTRPQPVRGRVDSALYGIVRAAPPPPAQRDPLVAALFGAVLAPPPAG